jgi:hypothetical protein
MNTRGAASGTFNVLCSPKDEHATGLRRLRNAAKRHGVVAGGYSCFACWRFPVHILAQTPTVGTEVFHSFLHVSRGKYLDKTLTHAMAVSFHVFPNPSCILILPFDAM